jgi:multidrug resistance protein
MPDNVNTFEVYWDGPSDFRNPLNWSTRKKWANIFVISVAGFLWYVAYSTTNVFYARFLIKERSPLVSSMPSPATSLISLEFKNTSSNFPTFVVSIFVLGFAFGSPALAPLSEVYGRLPIYHSANAVFLLSLILCAIAQNSAMILAFRFLSGLGGGAAIAIAPGSITDMMKREERGRAISVWAVGTILGPMIGPVIGAYITESLGWRWMFWIIAIVVSDMTSAMSYLLTVKRSSS